MKKYEWILFDADDTLFRFDAFHGLTLLFSNYNIPFTKDDYDAYQTINKSLWVEYQDGDISAEKLQCQRFEAWGNKLNVSPLDLNRAFLNIMADVCDPLEGAKNLLEFLRGKAKLGIITNGFTALQQARLTRTGLNDYFELLVISEQVGCAKPHLAIFEHAFSAMGNPDPKNVLMVGDTLESDILGGLNAGLDTCWMNADNKQSSENIKPLYQVSSLNELEKMLNKGYGAI